MITNDTPREAHIDSLLESSEGIVVVLDGNDRILRLSKGARQTLGYDDRDISGSNVLVMVPPDRKDWMAAISKRAREDGIVQDVFMHWKTKDGRRLISRSTLRSVINYQGDIVGVIITESFKIPRDPKREAITPEQAMELLQASEIAIVVTDLSGNVLSFSSGAEAFTGVSSAQIVGTSISRLFSNREILGEITTRALRDGKVEDCEMTLMGSGDEKRRVSVSLSVIRNPSGAAMSFSFVIVDITKRKEMERELELRAERLRLVNDLAKRVGSGRSLTEIYSTAADGLSRLVRFDMMTLINIAEADEGVQIVSFEGEQPSWLSNGYIILPGRGPFGRALKDRKPVIYTSLEIEGMLGRRLSEGQEFNSGVIVPLLAGERLLGLLNFSSSVSRAFGAREMTVLIPVADHIALAMEKSRLVTALMENINIQTSLMETGTALRSLMEIDRLFGTSISRAQELISSDLGALYTLQDNLLSLVSSDGIELARLPQTISAGEDNLISAHFFGSGNSLIRNVQRYEKASAQEKDCFGSIIMVKLMGMKGPMGLLLLSRDSDNSPYGTYELELLNLYGNHLSPSIENARLFEGIKRSEIKANEALESERRTREALNFIFNMFAHDSQNQIHAVLGYLELVSQSDIPPETQKFIERAIRQLRAGSYLISDTALLFKHLGGERRSRRRENVLIALQDAIQRFSMLHPDMEVKWDTSSISGSDENIDTLLSGLFFHIIRLMTKASTDPGVEIELSKPVTDSGIRVDFRIQSGSLTKEILRTLDEDQPPKSDGMQLLDPFVVRLLSEIYGARISSASEGDSRDKSTAIHVCTLEFLASDER